jgi:hypothetical protein
MFNQVQMPIGRDDVANMMPNTLPDIEFRTIGQNVFHLDFRGLAQKVALPFLCAMELRLHSDMPPNL